MNSIKFQLISFVLLILGLLNLYSLLQAFANFFLERDKFSIKIESRANNFTDNEFFRKVFGKILFKFPQFFREKVEKFLKFKVIASNIIILREPCLVCEGLLCSTVKNLKCK